MVDCYLMQSDKKIK